MRSKRTSGVDPSHTPSVSIPRDRVEAAVSDGSGCIRIRVKAQPRAKRDELVGSIDDGRGGVALKIAVRAPPVEGAANEAIEALLASVLRVARGQVEVAKGGSGRDKVVEVRGVAREAAIAALSA
jgi:uncharacterized protein (TIGR00251 family)